MFLGDSGVAFLQLHLWIVLVELACPAVLVFHILFRYVHVHLQVVDGHQTPCILLDAHALFLARLVRPCYLLAQLFFQVLKEVYL